MRDTISAPSFAKQSKIEKITINLESVSPASQQK